MIRARRADREERAAWEGLAEGERVLSREGRVKVMEEAGRGKEEGRVDKEWTGVEGERVTVRVERDWVIKVVALRGAEDWVGEGSERDGHGLCSRREPQCVYSQALCHSS